MLFGANGKRIAIVLADGVWENQGRAIAAAQSCHHMGIDVAGIGFGQADEEFLKAISSGDIHAMLVEQSELTQSFGKIAQEIGGDTASKHGRANDETSVATWLAINEG